MQEGLCLDTCMVAFEVGLSTLCFSIPLTDTTFRGIWAMSQLAARMRGTTACYIIYKGITSILTFVRV
jgi:hypothetical protein